MADRDGHERAGPRGGSRTRLRFAADDRLVALVRHGDAIAFEILYDRHAGELLSFCGYLLGSRADAEDAIQSTFASAHTALLADDRPIDARPWLFTIARNACLSILRARRPAAEGSLQTPRDEDDPVARAEQREDMRGLLATLGELPERQRVALVLRELHGFSHGEIAALLGVRAEQVKSYVHQARSNVISERDARDADCRAIRHELANARGPALLKSQLRRHLRSCPGCRAYAARLSRQRRQLGILLPLTPSVALKHRALHAALRRGSHAGGATAGGASTGGAAAGGAATGGAATGGAAAGGAATGMSVAATGAEIVGGGAKAVIAKLLVGAACVGAGSSAATLVAGVPLAPAPRLLATAQPRLVTLPPLAVRAPIAEPVPSIPTAAPRSAPVARPGATGVSHAAPHLASQPPATAVVHAWQASRVDAAVDPAASAARATRVPFSGSDEAHGNGSASEQAHGKNEQPHGKGEERAQTPAGSEEPHGESEAHGRSEDPHGKDEERAQTRGGSEEPHGGSEEAQGEGEAGEQPHGNSEAANGNGEAGEGPHGNGEADRGNGEQAHGNGAN